MSRPRAPKAHTAVKTEVPAAVQAVLDQIDAVQVEEVVDPFARPVEADPFANTAFASTAEASDAFAAVASASAAFGPAASTEFAPRATRAFQPQGPRPDKGKRRIVRRRFILPPLEGEPKPWSQYWMQMCDYLGSFSNPDDGRLKLWRPGHHFDFSRAEEAARYLCIEEMFESGEDPFEDHLPTEEDEWKCGSNDHFLHAEEDDCIEKALIWCGHDWEPQDDWDRLVPILTDMRERALRDADEMIPHLPGLSYFFAVAGYTPELMPSSHWHEELFNAVRNGPHNRGLAAAYADYMARDWIGAFCGHLDCGDDCTSIEDGDCDCDACDVEQGIKRMAEYDFMPTHPQCVFTFDVLREPVQWDVVHGGRVVPRIVGEYVVERVEYFSALAEPYNTDTLTGEVGWNVLHLVPADEDLVEIGDDDHAGDIDDAA